jgi:hypothetical protein
MKKLSFILLSAILFTFTVACKQKTEKASEEKAGPALSCTGEQLEAIRGEEVYKGKYNSDGDELLTYFSLEQDSCFIFSVVPSVELKNEYLKYEVTVIAYKDINSVAEEGLQFRSEEVEGETKTSLLILSKNDERIFKQKTFSCFGDNNAEQIDLSGMTIDFSSAEKGKAVLEQLKAKLPTQ